MSDARAQLFAAVERGVAEVLDREIAGIAEDVADQVVERLAATQPGSNGAADGAPLIDAAEVARRHGTTREWAYENAERLGAIRLGDGPKARLRFDPTIVAEALGRPSRESKPAPTQPRSRRHRSDVELLPIGSEKARA